MSEHLRREIAHLRADLALDREQAAMLERVAEETAAALRTIRFHIRRNEGLVEAWASALGFRHPASQPRDTSPHKGRGDAPRAIPAVNRVAAG